jgi:WD40 repeat protein
MNNLKKYFFFFLISLLALTMPAGTFAQNTVSNSNEIKLPSKGAKRIKYSNDQKQMAIADLKKVMLLLSGGNYINKIIKTGYTEINDIEFLGDNKRIAVCGKSMFGNKIKIYDIKDGTLVKEISGLNGLAQRLSASRDNQYLAVVTTTGYLVVYNTDNFSKHFQIKLSKGIFTDVKFNRKSTRIYCGSSTGNFYEVNIENGSYAKEFFLDKAYIRSIAVSNDNRYVACGYDNGNCKLVDVLNKYTTYNLTGSQKRIYSLSFSQDDRFLASSSESNFICLWSIEEMNIKKMYNPPKVRSALTAVAFDPGCKIMYAANFKSKKLHSIDVSDLNITPKVFLKNDNDVIPPNINLINPVLIDNRFKTNKESVNLRISVVDESGVFSVKLNGSPLTLGSDNEVQLPFKLAMGENQFTIEATDVNDMTSLKKFTIVRDNSDDDDLIIDYSSKNFFFAVGIDDYEHWPKLSNAVNDAQKVKEILMKRYNFKEENMYLLKNEQATKQNIINELKKLVERAGSNDRIIFYFSGHGSYDNILNEGYWIPVDAKRDNEGDYIPNSYMVKLLRQIAAKHVFLVADACFSGSLFVETRRSGIDLASQIKSRWGLTSGRLEYVDDGKQGEHSPFAKQLIDVLSNNKKSRITAAEIILQVKEKVSEESKQVPIGNVINYAGDEGGEFVLDLFGE